LTKSVEAAPHCTVRERDGEVRLPAAGLAYEDRGVAFGDEVRREQRADGRETKDRLVREVELLDRAQERKLRGTHGALHARASTVRDLLAEEDEEQVVVGPLLGLCAPHQLAPRASGVGEV
jgi:hypothetical protein